MPLSFIASAGTACLVEGEDEKIKIIQSPTWDELESSIASVQAVFNKRLVRRRSHRTQPPEESGPPSGRHTVVENDYF